ncbi:MAG: aconitase family protein [Desulfobacterales bacterium]|nr:aconitase family protein [Desulfobacterales bacterium]
MKKTDFLRNVTIQKKAYRFFDIGLLEKKGLAPISRLPFSIRVLVENLLRKLDGRIVTEKDVLNIARWKKRYSAPVEIPYHPARVLMQDFTGVPAVVDLAAMRDALQALGGDPGEINPLVPVDLVIDHSVQVDACGTAEALAEQRRPGIRAQPASATPCCKLGAEEPSTTSAWCPRAPASATR